MLLATACHASILVGPDRVEDVQALHEQGSRQICIDHDMLGENALEVLAHVLICTVLLTAMAPVAAAPSTTAVAPAAAPSTTAVAAAVARTV